MTILTISSEIAVVLLVAVALLAYAGYKDNFRKELAWIGSGALFLAISSILPTISEEIPMAAQAIQYLHIIFAVGGFVVALLGVLSIAIKSAKLPDHID